MGFSLEAGNEDSITNTLRSICLSREDGNAATSTGVNLFSILALPKFGGLPAAATLSQFAGTFCLLLLDALSVKLAVCCQLRLGFFLSLLLDARSVAFTLQNNRRHKTLDLRGFGPGLATRLEFAFDDVFADIVVLVQAEHLTNLGSTFRTEAAGNRSISQSFNGLFPLANNCQVKNANVWADDAATYTLAFASPSAAGTVAAQSFRQKQTHTVVHEHPLFHWETLLVVSTGNTEGVPLIVFTKSRPIYLVRNTAIVKREKHLFIIHIDELLLASAGVGDVKLHPCNLL